MYVCLSVYLSVWLSVSHSSVHPAVRTAKRFFRPSYIDVVFYYVQTLQTSRCSGTPAWNTHLTIIVVAVSLQPHFFPANEQMLSVLHWLQVEHRIRYRMAVLKFKLVRLVKPAYLSELFHRYASVRQRRSAV